MPVTHGVAGSSPVQTAIASKDISKLSFFIKQKTEKVNIMITVGIRVGASPVRGKYGVNTRRMFMPYC